MKKLLLVVVVLFAVQLTNAQNAENKWGLGAGAGYYHNFNWGQSDGLMPEFYLNRYLSPSFDLGLKANLGWMLNDLEKLGGTEKISTDLGNFFLDLRYKLNNGKIIPLTSKWQPFIFGGVGLLSDNSNKFMDFNGVGEEGVPENEKFNYTWVNFEAGVGTKYMLSKSWALFGELGFIGGVNGKHSLYDENQVKTGEVKAHDNFLKAIVGIEWAFSAKLDKDRDGVADHKDKCPDTPKGIVVDKTGCPLDKDGDGIPDSEDKCPDVKGIAAFAGCPDTDGDGIEDKKDDCPDVKGLAEFNGCPDTDGDGIIDSKDDCPTVKGVKEFKGCPDTDGDGIKDSEDECPTVPGVKKFNGCPDTDGDGVSDKDDKCPDTPKGAKVDDKGCPTDSDKDGVYDGIDECPDVFGVAEKKGCPDEEDMDKWLKNTKVNSIFFETNKWDITAESKDRMDKLIKLMKSNAKAKVKASGFADPRGTEPANKTLSVNRAKAAAEYLVSQGIDRNRITTSGLGEEFTGKENTMSDPELQNSRRVDFSLFK